jgi:O-antigen ligase
MIKGTQDVWAMVLFLSVAGFALFFIRPVARPGVAPLVLVPLFCCLCLLAFLPQDFFPQPQWRQALAALGTIPLGESVNPQPWLGWFWWWLLSATCFMALSLLTSPLSTRALAIVLHSAAFFVAAYASLTIFSAQTGWRYPFHGGAVFGFLPNRNHTATLLVVGSVLSFGLMQWRLSRGNSLAAAFAALCGAPALAGLLFFSVSRAGVVLLAAGLLLWSVGATRSSLLRARLLVAAAVLVVFLCLLFVAGGSVVRDRMADFTRGLLSVDAAHGASQYVDFRQPIFRDTLRMVADAPLTGAGLGQFADVFPQYRRASIREAVVLHPESDWLLVVTETGLPSAAVLAALLVWYVLVCWRSYSDSGGMLRWTAASAVTAAALHGAIDVPWHGFSLGWFLLILAASSVPSSGHPALRPALGRSIIMAGGLLLLAAATWIGAEKWRGRSPSYYRWPELAAELRLLGEQRRFDQAGKAAARAVQQFPLNYKTYYWQAGHLRAFEGTDPEIHAAIQAGRAVEPVLAVVPREQAAILADINPEWEAEARVEAIRRAALIDDRMQTSGSAVAELGKSISAATQRPQVQLLIRRGLGADEPLVAEWVCLANADLANEFLMGGGADRWLDGLPPDVRGRVLSRWANLPSGGLAVAYMETRNGAGSGSYWRQLANHYAKAGDKPKAVALVAEAKGVDLGGNGLSAGGFAAEVRRLQEQGNDVAVRRLVKEAAEAPGTSSEKASIAMVWYAQAGDWEMAWKAASRLVTATKTGQ